MLLQLRDKLWQLKYELDEARKGSDTMARLDGGLLDARSSDDRSVAAHSRSRLYDRSSFSLLPLLFFKENERHTHGHMRM